MRVLLWIAEPRVPSSTSFGYESLIWKSILQLASATQCSHRTSCAMMAGAILTPALLSSIRSTPHLPNSTYYLVAGAALSTLNLAQEIPHALRFALERGASYSDSKPNYDEKLRIARRMREAIIKLAPIAGLPKAPSQHWATDAATAALTPWSSQLMP